VTEEDIHIGLKGCHVTQGLELQGAEDKPSEQSEKSISRSHRHKRGYGRENTQDRQVEVTSVHENQ
jgi:hypothetical protein